ncbi:hypothetical protein A9G05_06830 [Pseudomonas sp. ENNP23]|nr:hypothetical protein A9G05_06830 [Pseudomonas sp. ENNP23]
MRKSVRSIVLMGCHDAPLPTEANGLMNSERDEKGFRTPKPLQDEAAGRPELTAMRAVGRIN